jgi:uncharacterized protein
VSDGAGALAPGHAGGLVLRLSEPLSLWGGVDPATGRIVDRRHPQRGRSVAGTILAMSSGRGSSSSSSILAECVRAGTAPLAIVVAEADPILAIGSVVANELYGRAVPVVVVDRAVFDSLHGGDLVTVDAREDGSATIEHR